MKKFLVFALCSLFLLSACDKQKKVTPEFPDPETPVVAATLNVEHLIATDRQDMFMKYGGNYRWFETDIKLEDYLDSEDCDGTVHSVSNVFEVIEDTTENGGADVFVVLYSHVGDTAAIETKAGFWIENLPMEEEAVKLTYEEAFEKVMETNLPKPHSRNCIIRKPLGPLDCNVQYVFGNLRSQIWVDAVTGEAKASNPAFPDGSFKMPLGEWP